MSANNVVRLVTNRLMGNRAMRTLTSMFPSFFPSTKHNFYCDFGFPDTVGFEHTYRAFKRNSIARAAVNKTVGKTWQSEPYLLEQERDGSQQGIKAEETKLEKDLRVHFKRIRFWSKLMEVDRRSMVGEFSAVILRIADGKGFDQPVSRLRADIELVVDIIPVWKAQLTVSEWDTDTQSPNYGMPIMYSFKEQTVGDNTLNKINREIRVHPDRLLIWSSTGSLEGESILEPGYNDLISLEKIVGAGGEGFWKNAKSAPVLEMDAEASLEEMAKASGLTTEDVIDKVDEQVEAYQKGFDNLLFLHGIQAKQLNVSLPSPEHFFSIALQSFASSVEIPMKILVGTQTGERASTEDARDWAQTCMSRRTNIVIPNILSLVKRLEYFGILPPKDWYLDWSDLMAASANEKMSRAKDMAEINHKTIADMHEVVFTPEEIRATVDYEPLADNERFLDDEGEDEEETQNPNDPDKLPDDPEEVEQ